MSTDKTREIIQENQKQIQDDEFRWYTLSVVTGQEQLVVENLKERVARQWLWEMIKDFFSPVVPEVLMRKWKNWTHKKIIRQKKLYPWYVFVNSKMNDKIWYVIRNTPWVRLIVWSEIHPIPLTDQEYQDIMKQIEEKNQKIDQIDTFKEWDVVKINDWDFKWISWVITEVDFDRQLLNIRVEMLWKSVPVIISFLKVEALTS